MDPVHMVAGAALMVGAVCADPWGRSSWAAAAYLLGASLWVWGFLQ